jgi:hypothetical protein
VREENLSLPKGDKIHDGSTQIDPLEADFHDGKHCRNHGRSQELGLGIDG